MSKQNKRGKEGQGKVGRMDEDVLGGSRFVVFVVRLWLLLPGSVGVGLIECVSPLGSNYYSKGVWRWYIHTYRTR
jgi:hypothetical protein